MSLQAATRNPGSMLQAAIARALMTVALESPGLLSDVDMLNDPREGDPRPAAADIVRSLAADPEMVEVYARALHDAAHRNFPHEFGPGCPDGELDANVWRSDAADLLAALVAGSASREGT